MWEEERRVAEGAGLPTAARLPTCVSVHRPYAPSNVAPTPVSPAAGGSTAARTRAAWRRGMPWRRGGGAGRTRPVAPAAGLQRVHERGVIIAGGEEDSRECVGRVASVSGAHCVQRPRPMETRQRRTPAASTSAPSRPSEDAGAAPTTAKRRPSRASRALPALALAAAALAIWTGTQESNWSRALIGGRPPPSPRPTAAEHAAAAADLAREAAPAVDRGASGYVSEDALNRHGADEDTLRARAASAVAGAFLADAAASAVDDVPEAELTSLLAVAGLEGRPEFFRPPTEAATDATSGDFSPSAYEVLPLLQSLLGANGFQAGHYGAAAAQYLRDTPRPVAGLPAAWAAALAASGDFEGSGLDSPAATAVVKVSLGGGRVEAGPFLPFLDPPPTPPLPPFQVPVVVARFAGTPTLRRALAGAVRVHQAHAGARAAAGAAAAVLERLLVLGEALPAAVAAASTCDALSAAGRAMLAAALDRSASGTRANPDPPHPHGATAADTLSSALDAALAHPGDYSAAVRAAVAAGGPGAAPRAQLAGAWLAAAAAAGHAQQPPADWVARAPKLRRVEAMARLLLHQRGVAVPVAMPGQDVGPDAEVVATV